MSARRPMRYCRCGTRLARDNGGNRCASCQAKLRDLVTRPPLVPASFWATDAMREALASWHMGGVIAAYRHHPFHERPLSQEIVAGWVGITQAQLSRIETGPAIKDLDRLARWAGTLGVPEPLLWFKLPKRHHADMSTGSIVAQEVDHGRSSRHQVAEIDDMNRRELLRLMSISGALMTAHGAPGDGSRPRELARGKVHRAPPPLEQYEDMNSALWNSYAAATSKASVFRPARRQLGVLIGGLEMSNGPTMHKRLCALSADLYQLAGEVLFDCNQYTEAAHCYTLAASAGRDADAFDLWACAMTRHAFIGVYERQFDKAMPLLDVAAVLAERGDGALSTRYWCQAVRAQALAGLGDRDGCERALDAAEEVHRLDDGMHNGGWLRFDGSRLPEERGSCYIELGRADLAEPVLVDALNRDLSERRRGSVLVDLAMVGLLRRDPIQLVMHGNAAMEIARRTRSGFIGRKLTNLQDRIRPFLTDSHVRQLDRQITALTDTESG